LVKKYNVPVVAISNDDTGISEDPDVRFAVARKIVQRAADFGIPACDIVVDPLVMPIGAMATAGRQVFDLVRRFALELGVNTTCGASNISFGLPNRHGVNAAFLPMAMGAGMTSAIMNPVRAAEMEAIRAANLLLGHDPNGGEWINLSRVIDAMKEGRKFCRGLARGDGCGRAHRGAAWRAQVALAWGAIFRIPATHVNLGIYCAKRVPGFAQPAAKQDARSWNTRRKTRRRLTIAVIETKKPKACMRAFGFFNLHAARQPQPALAAAFLASA
jgi:hypothetical protein